MFENWLDLPPNDCLENVVNGRFVSNTSRKHLSSYHRNLPPIQPHRLAMTKKGHHSKKYDCMWSLKNVRSGSKDSRYRDPFVSKTFSYIFLIWLLVPRISYLANTGRPLRWGKKRRGIAPFAVGLPPAVVVTTRSSLKEDIVLLGRALPTAPPTLITRFRNMNNSMWTLNSHFLYGLKAQNATKWLNKRYELLEELSKK